MQELISFQNNVLNAIKGNWHRYLYPVLNKNNRLIGIKGLRGIGKTTMFLQYLATNLKKGNKTLYVTADHPYFYKNSLFNLASEWYKYGGTYLLIDEIHKYPLWSRELKLIYDGHPDLKILFTSSSAIELFKGESDLSRRLVSYNLYGLSFREYLDFFYGLSFQPLQLTELLKNHDQFIREITHSVKILPLFKNYLAQGYFPFIKDVENDTVMQRILQIINAVLDSDLAYVEDYNASHIIKIKKLLGVIAEIAPFEPNISKIANKLQIGRNTVNTYLKKLHEAQVLHLIHKPGKGISLLQKPDKLYFENPGFAYAFQTNPEIGTIRETFFLNQLHSAGYKINVSPSKSDFLVEDTYTFEIGGQNKSSHQIQSIPHSYKALDEIEHGFNNTIPLWLFGFLY